MSAQALQLIAENIRTKNPVLDLGNCGLIELYPELLAELAKTGEWLEELIWSNNWWDLEAEERKYSQNRGHKNEFPQLPPSLPLLPNLRVLVAAELGITDCSPLAGFHALNKLDISSNQIADCSPLAGLNALNMLHISDNQIADCSPLAGLNALNNLTISGNQIADCSPLAGLYALNKLHISGNKIADCSPLAGLKALNKLHISGNKIADCSPLAGLHALNELHIYDNQIADCSPLAGLNALNTLYISNNQINDCSPLAGLKALNKLHISGNKIADCSPLAGLNALNTLHISRNQIADCSPLAGLHALNTLEISSNQISDCSPLAGLYALNTLDISSNQIADCSPLAGLHALNTLYIWSNQITDCSPLAGLHALNTLYISINPIADCSPLAGLHALNALHISRNQIADCSPLAGLNALNELYIYDNQIADCSPLAGLHALNTLNISGNKIADCSPLAGLKALNILDISSNKIADCSPLLPLIKKGIPIMFEWKPGHKTGLYPQDNPIKNPPLEILQEGNEAVLRYFQSGQLRPLNECKLIFVGDGQVGKTSLMRRLVGQRFNPKEQTTHGINKVAWKGIKNKQKSTIRVNLWDFGGQHIQHSLHQFFFTERVIYVLVLNPRNDEKAGYWLEQIAALGKDSLVLVVYNWKDEKDKEANYLNNFYELRKKYSQLPDPFLLSCKTGDGVAKFKRAIQKAVLNHEGLQVQYPATWFNIKARLEKDIPVDASYIGYQTYKQWCTEADYSDPDAQKGLLKILDAIGSIVFFDKPILNEYPVLNPEWITTGAYAILVAEQTKDKQGHLGWKDLKAIFKEKKTIFSDKEVRIQFDEHQFLFIMELMLTYNLCQKNPFAENEYLIPAAFGEKPTKDYEHAKAGARQYRLKFESPFEMLIIHRFIAKNLLKITDKDYWQSGIYIKHPSSDTFALVETNLYSKEINCWIKGENVRGFWEVIRNDFHEILSMYHNLPYAEEVLYEKDGRGIFLPYHEMLIAFRKGINNISYHPTYQLEDINVLGVLELFETPAKTAEKDLDFYSRGNHENITNIIPRKRKNIDKAAIFFSYAWGEEREKIVDQLYDALLADNYLVKRDKKDVQYGDSIVQFMDELGASAHIIVAISDHYLKSEYCMYELYKAYEQSKSDLKSLRNKIYPIRVEALQLDRPAVLKSYIQHWEGLEAEWEDLVSSKSTRISAVQHKRYTRIKSIAAKLGDLLDFLADINASTTDILSQNNFEVIKKTIQQRMRG